MTRRILILAIIGVWLVVVGLSYGHDVAKTKPVPGNLKFITGEEPIPQAQYYPSNPRLVTQSPGDTVGMTQYDYQTNGSTGNRAVIDFQGAQHFAWMNGINYTSGLRRIYYNYHYTDWGWPNYGTDLSYQNGDGYTQISVTADGRAVVAYHNFRAGAESLIVAIDSYSGFGFFNYFHPPNRLGAYPLTWPYITVDQQGRIHLVATQNTGTPQPFAYTRSNNGGTTWTSLQRVDSLMDLSAIMTSSFVSGKVAIVYTHPRDTTTQWRNNIYYVQSQDGVTWDFRGGKVNVTQYGQGGDSLWAYTDCDAVYDYNDNLHIVWNAQYVTDAGIYYSTQLLHYDLTSGTIHQITQFDTTWLSSGCETGGWNFMIAKMSIGVDPANDLFTTYTSWDTSDCSASGYANGDIYMNYSTDGGATWSADTNLTHSPTPGCAAGDCDSDHWSSLAEKVDTHLHLFYVNDKDPGGIPQTEGAVTDNPMLYLAYPNPVFSSVNEKPAAPRDFALSQNYPNPFNAATSIGFNLSNDTDIDLVVYDLTGAVLTTLASGRMAAGAHRVTWNGSDVASGVYYYKLTTEAGSLVRKMTLLK